MQKVGIVTSILPGPLRFAIQNICAHWRWIFYKLMMVLLVQKPLYTLGLMYFAWGTVVELTTLYVVKGKVFDWERWAFCCDINCLLIFVLSLIITSIILESRELVSSNFLRSSVRCCICHRFCLWWVSFWFSHIDWTYSWSTHGWLYPKIKKSNIIIKTDAESDIMPKIGFFFLSEVYLTFHNFHNHVDN